MIQKEDFLKLVGNMTQPEVDQYWIQLQRWNDETYPRLCALTDAWSECDIKDYRDGVLLASALRSAREWCTQAMSSDAQKRLKRLRYYLNEVTKFMSRNKIEAHVLSTATGKPSKIGIVMPLPRVDENGDEIPSKPAPRLTHKALHQNTVQSSVAEGNTDADVNDASSFHPSHLSDYIHRLSPQLQKESENLQTWYLELSEYHFILEQLVGDKRSSQADRRYYARLVVKIENKILSFYHRVNAEWEEINGKHLSSETKQELERERRSAASSTINEGGSMSKEEIDALSDPELRKKFTEQRIKRDVRYLAERVRRKDAEVYVREALRELKEWNHLITQQSADKVKEWYGIDVDSSQVQPTYTDEEKAAIRKEKRSLINKNYSKRKAERKNTEAEKEAKKRIRKEEREKQKAEEKLRYQEMARSMGADDE